jgi:hypothetical protein
LVLNEKSQSVFGKGYLPFALANGKAAALASGQCKHSPQALPFAKANGK